MDVPFPIPESSYPQSRCTLVKRIPLRPPPAFAAQPFRRAREEDVRPSGEEEELRAQLPVRLGDRQAGRSHPRKLTIII